MVNELLLNELEELTVQGAHDTFKVNDLDSANWCFRKLRALKEQEAEYKQLAQKEIDRITNWLNGEVEKLSSQETFFQCLLTEYALEQRKENTKFKMSTPFGKLTFRKQQPKWNYEEEALLNNLKASKLDNLIRIKEEVNKVELKKVSAVVDGKVVIDGEIITGIEVIEQPETIKIEVEI